MIVEDDRRGYAIVGIGCNFPGNVHSPEQFWALLQEGRDAIVEVPADRPDWAKLYDPDIGAAGKIYARWGGFIDGVDQFDARFFGISPREATRIDPQQRMLLEVVWHAFEDARLPVADLAGSDVGVFIGVSTHDYADVQMYPQHREAIDAHSNTGGATAIVANRISYVYDFRGPSMAVDTACSSALTAVHLACQSLDTGDCTIAVAGGVQLLLRPELTMGFCRATMLSVDGRCKAFDRSGNGYVRSEGAGAVILKPLGRAIDDGDPIYAVILGSAINQDGHSPGLTVPSEASQQAMLRTSLRRSGVKPQAIQYFEAHGTGTAVGDPIEARAIGSVFSEGRADADPLRLGSVKTNLGHLEAASGMPGLIKTALALNHRQLPPSLHFNEWNPSIDSAALKLRMVTKLEPWPETTFPPAAGINSFGFGGANASVILGASPAPAPAPTLGERQESEILALSARSPEALRALALAYSGLLTSDGRPVADLCGAAALGRSHQEYRLAVTGATHEALGDALDSFASGDSTARIASGRASSGLTEKLAFVFSGMGPQWWGMGRQLLEHDPVFKAMMERCDAALRPHSGWSLIDEFRADEATSRIAHPLLAQVTNFALQVSLAEVWKSWGIAPGAVVGHSGGAMAAAYSAGIHSLEDAIWLCFHRSRLQGRDSNAGEMLAVGLPASEAEALIRGHEMEVSLAAVNGPATMTLAGNGEVLRAIAAKLTERQVFARMLAVTIAYHSPKMDPIKEEFLEAVGGLKAREAALPFVSDTTGTWENGAACNADYWWRAIRSPVRFADSVGTMIDAGYTAFIEISPHPVLASSINECLAARGVKGLVVGSLRRNDDDRGTMLRSLGSLYANGASPAWRSLYRRDTSVPLPLYPFQRERHWFDPGEGSGDDLAQGDADVNLLLGHRLPSAQPSWETRLGDAGFGYLDDHIIQGAAIYPGAGYVAMGLAAARRLDARAPAALRDVEFLRPLVLSDRGKIRAQVSVDPDTLKFHVFAGSGSDRGAWSRYATGRFSRGAGGIAERLDPMALAQRLGDGAEPSTFYEGLRSRGLAYGPRFKGIQEIWRNGHEALARIGPVAGLTADPDSVHPALLDAAFQLLAVIADTAGPADDRLFLPTRIEEVQLHRPAAEAFWTYCRLDSQNSEHVIGSLQIVAEDGAPVLSVRGFRAQLVEAAGNGTDAINQWLYEYRWEPKAIAGDESRPRRAAVLPSASGLNVGAAQAIARIEGETGWPSYYTEAEPIISDYAAAQVQVAFAALGLPSGTGDLIGDPALDQVKAREPSGGIWVERLLGLLAETGRIEPAPGGWRVLRSDPPAPIPERLPSYSSDFSLLAEAGRTLPAALVGGSGGKDVVFTAESLPLLQSFYSEAPASAFYNRVLADAVAKLVAESDPAGRLRVLEIGAGTGGATGALLAELPPDRTHYLFTDVAPLLLDSARDRFGDTPFLQTQLLDISRDPAAQGFAPESFDLIVAANVVHATPDVRASLERIHGLLVPGGSLAMIEITRHPRWLDVIFGQTRGWWSFADRDLRREHPLLESAQWFGQLRVSGFRDVWMSAEPGSEGEAAQTVIVASTPRGVPAKAPWLVFSDDGGPGPQVAGRLERLGHRVLTVTGTESPGVLDTLQSAPAGILHLGSIGATEDFSVAQTAGLYSALSLFQAVLARPALRNCPMWFVSSGAAMLPDDQSNAVLQTPLWGLGRTLLKEHPEMRLQLIDIDPAGGEGAIAALLREITEHDPDEEIALRGSRRYVRRLRRIALSDLPESRKPSGPADAHWRAEVGTRGSLGSLRLRGFRPAAPAPHEVRVDIKAASLNFRDVMLAMGGIPGLEDELSFGHQYLGSDCAGIVTAVGEAVTRFRPGDAVMGMAPGALASSSTTSSLLLAHKPDCLEFREAASVPTTFLTAWYALHRLARLQKGETVLIHAASGGVGLAAIQIAQDAGAEIFATAGSDTKRDHLRAIGIEHVMDSRSLAFAEEVKKLTGGAGVDVVLNSLTGEAIERGIACLKPYGRFLEIGKMDIYTNRDLPLGRFRQNLSYFAIDLDRLCAEKPALVGEMLQELAAALEARRFMPLPRHDFDMAQMEEAFRLMAQARHIGKIVLTRGRTPQLDRVDGLDKSIRSDGSYLVTGGLGGFGLEVAERLASAAPGAIVLMGRSAPKPEAIDRIAALRRAGTRIEVVAGDVSRVADVDSLLARITRDLPPLRGIFHGAMVLDDRRVEDIDAASLDRVMGPKALGAWNLHLRTTDSPLDHFVMFSSITSVLGNPRQANYAAASAFLDGLATHRRASGLPGLAINWGVLAGSGYVAERQNLQQFLEQQGYSTFSPKQALDVLAALLERETPQVMAARVDWGRLAASSPRAAASPRIAELIPTEDRGSAKAPTSDLVISLATAAPDERRALLEVYLAKTIGRVLGISPAEIESERTFDELGLDSLLAVELMIVLTGDLGFETPVIALLDGMHVRKLAGLILAEVDLSGNVAPTKTNYLHSVPRAGEPERPVAKTPAPAPLAADLPSPGATNPEPASAANPSTAPEVDHSGAEFAKWSALQAAVRGAFKVGFRALGKVEVYGLENMPRSGPFILAVNHLSMADVPLALTVMPRRTIILANERLKQSPVLDLFVGWLGEAIYVSKGGDSAHALQNALQVLENGGIVALAPEGTRSRAGLKRAQTGVAWLAQRSGLPVVPYVAWGQERWRDRMRQATRLPINVRIGAPIQPPRDRESDLRAYSDEVMLALAQMLPPEYRGAYADKVRVAELQ